MSEYAKQKWVAVISWRDHLLEALLAGQTALTQVRVIQCACLEVSCVSAVVWWDVCVLAKNGTLCHAIASTD